MVVTFSKEKKYGKNAGNVNRIQQGKNLMLTKKGLRTQQLGAVVLHSSAVKAISTITSCIRTSFASVMPACINSSNGI